MQKGLRHPETLHRFSIPFSYNYNGITSVRLLSPSDRLYLSRAHQLYRQTVPKVLEYGGIMQPASPLIAHGSSPLVNLHSESNCEEKRSRWILLKGLTGHESSTAAQSELILWKVILTCGFDPSHFSITGRVAEVRKEWEAERAVLIINEECEEKSSALRAVYIDFKRYRSYLFDCQRSRMVHYGTNRIERKTIHRTLAAPSSAPDQSQPTYLSKNSTGQFLLHSHLLSSPSSFLFSCSLMCCGTSGVHYGIVSPNF
jgi:hypothetical protein